MHPILVLAQLAMASASPVGMPTAHLTRASAPAVAEPNDNRRAAGRLVDGVLTIALEVREAAWYPETRRGPGVRVYAFAEVGGASSVPGPLLRVPAGTRIRATVRNPLDKPLMMRGLQDHTGTVDSTEVAPGAVREFDFTPSTPGTYFYWGRTEKDRALLGYADDAALQGAFIVDAGDAPPPSHERILMIQLWLGEHTLGDSAGTPKRELETITVNGLSWPHTERLEYTAGDSVEWRIINASVAPHPMHLHGFYFRVDSRGHATTDSTYDAPSRRLVVTEFMAPATTMRMAWVPKRPGNWLFHCHLIAHVDVRHVKLGGSHDAHSAHGARAPGAGGAAVNHAETGMAGLVTGILVHPAPGVTQAAEPRARRRIRTFVNARANVFGDQPGYSMVVQQGAREPARDSITQPGGTLVLRQHEPTEITVHNRSAEQVTIHWHGIELDSYYDGVGGWSGYGARVAPAIAPGDSFVARMTPDRAGTFIYHTHMEEGGQLSSGLYGALLVLAPGAVADTATDRVFLLGAGGPQAGATPFINGKAMPAPLELDAGVTYRLRLINISPSDMKRVRLIAASDSAVQTWRAFAKDGAELPAHQATVRPAIILLGPGETYDYEVRRDAGTSLVLEVRTSIRGARAVTSGIPVRFR